MTPSSSRLTAWLQGALSTIWREVLKFGIIGAIAFVIDVGVMNLLRHTVMEDKPTTAKIVSASVATVFAWIGNREWTFRHRRNRAAHHEFSLFVLTNGVALAIGAGAIAFSHYGLGQKTLLADNVANIVGIALGTLFRFWAYRAFVFSGELEDGASASASETNNANTAGSARTSSSRP
ncbi:MAG: GtrA family protein [Dermatophilaceae bacterium]|mgnify:FL=1